MSCILFGRLHARRRRRRRLVNSFKEITKHGSHLCASISLPHFIVVANVLKMCLFQGNRFGCQHHRCCFHLSLTMPVHTVDVEFGVIELAHNYFDCGNLARCSIHPLLYDTIHIESV